MDDNLSYREYVIVNTGARLYVCRGEERIELDQSRRLQRVSPWRRRTTASSSRHPWASTTTSTSCWSACSRRSASSWRTPRGPARCSGRDHGRIAANRRWARARRTIRPRSTAAVGPAPAWRCAICSTRCGRATANRRAARICTSCERCAEEERDSRWSATSKRRRCDLFLRNGGLRINEGRLSWHEYRPALDCNSRLRGRRGDTCVSLCKQVPSDLSGRVSWCHVVVIFPVGEMIPSAARAGHRN